MTSNFYLTGLLEEFDGFIGVFARDNLPAIKPIKYGSLSLIVNTNSLSDNGGGHWLLISLIFNNNQVQLCEVFDSLNLGLEYLHEDISVYIKRMRVETKFNNRQIQCISSDFCGFFCVCRFLSIFVDEPLSLFLNKFNYINLSNNDILVIRFIKKYLNVINRKDK